MKNYFSHDSNARGDDKIVALRMQHGWQGYGVFWAIIEKLYECPDVVNDFGLFAFSEDGGYFYSESLNRRLDIQKEKIDARKDACRRGGIKSGEVRKSKKRTKNEVKLNTTSSEHNFTLNSTELNEVNKSNVMLCNECNVQETNLKKSSQISDVMYDVTSRNVMAKDEIFEDWFLLYGHSPFHDSFSRCLAVWERFTDEEIEQIFAHTQLYVQIKKDETKRHNPLNYLQKRLFDEYSPDYYSVKYKQEKHYSPQDDRGYRFALQCFGEEDMVNYN
ncbi:MAG: DUF4373 domain-containing protein [Ignavibacteria bacterium]|jgi:hypothetical protein|nr:DUF4373 domain-containing protein [Ignavibacteria bacterium]